MKEQTGNMLLVACDALVVTTNGYVNKQGKAVMGRGIAKSVSQQIPDIARTLGELITARGNITQMIKPPTDPSPAVISMPVKPVSFYYTSEDQIVSYKRDQFMMGQQVPGCFAVASQSIIEQSAQQLVTLTDNWGWDNVILPRAGCGAGELSWDEVKPILDAILDDRFTAYTLS